MTACKKHRANPAVGYNPCPGCEVERLRAERDALAAHVDRLEDIIERSTLADSPAAESALEDTPATSLARLIAEHVDAAIGHAESLIEAGATPEEAFAAVRRQAEGNES